MLQTFLHSWIWKSSPSRGFLQLVCECVKVALNTNEEERQFVVAAATHWWSHTNSIASYQNEGFCRCRLAESRSRRRITSRAVRFLCLMCGWMDRLVLIALLQSTFAAMPLGAFVMSHIFPRVSCVYSVVSETGWDTCGRSDVIALWWAAIVQQNSFKSSHLFSQIFETFYTWSNWVQRASCKVWHRRELLGCPFVR